MDQQYRKEKFPASDALNKIIDGQGAENKGIIRKHIILHLKNLKCELNRYFLDLKRKVDRN